MHATIRTVARLATCTLSGHAAHRSSPSLGSLRPERPKSARRQTGNQARHHPLTRWLHWSTALLLVVAVASICLRDGAGDRTLRALLLTVHESSGIAMLALTLGRLAWRAYARVGAVNAVLSRAQLLLAGALHYVLYAALVGLTLLGWLTADATSIGPRLFGVLPLPRLIGIDRNLGDDLQQWHAEAAWLLLALVAVHVAAALWHHYVRRDAVLRSMLPPAAGKDRSVRPAIALAAAVECAGAGC